MELLGMIVSVVLILFIVFGLDNVSHNKPKKKDKK